MKKTIFTAHEKIRATLPMVDTTFHKWLKEQPPETIDNFVQALRAYMPDFNTTTDKLPSTQVRRHSLVFDNFHWLRNRNLLEV